MYFENSAGAGVSDDEVCARDVRCDRWLEPVHVDCERVGRTRSLQRLVLPAALLNYEPREARAREHFVHRGVVDSAD